MDPMVSAIIPSLDGNRLGNLEILKKQLNTQTLRPCEVLIVSGISPNGKARNTGALKARGDFLLFIDDDISLGNEHVIRNLVNPFSTVKNLGMTGASQLIPEDSNWFQRCSAPQIPRSSVPVQKELVESDMVTHACMCIPAKLFNDVGMENPEIVSGTDPDLRHRIREAGYRICLVPDTWVYHPVPASFSELVSSAFIKGRNSAIVRRSHPELIFETEDELTRNFTPMKPLASRVTRIIYRIFYMLFTLKFIGFAFYIAYTAGNLYGTLAVAPVKQMTDGRGQRMDR